MEYGCIGEKLGHSFSKEIHARLFDYSYELREIPRDGLADFLRARDFKAINVTIPYKQDVIPFLDWIDKTAEQIGAINTIVNRDGRLYGYNTDFLGLTDLLSHIGIDPAGKKVLVLGSGGTSRTAAAVAKALGAAAVYRVSRSGRDGCITYEQAVADHADAGVLMNTTPCGMYPNNGEMPVDLTHFPALTGVVDAIYNPLRPALVLAAQERGIPASGGLYMLVSQAVHAACRFTGLSLPDGRTDEVYRLLLREKENIVLTGMPGCGKTTVGRRLADVLGMEFIDIDEEIVRHEGRDIPAIFADVGEAGFREIESRMIRQMSARQHTVIATGGGAVLCRENIAALRENGRIFYLDRPFRLLVTTDDRPLSSNREKLRQRYEERYDIYRSTADHIINCAGDIEQNTAAVKEAFLA